MTGIIDYAHTETRSFADLPFNEIDALIISTLIYEDVASVCPTLMLDETRSGSFAARIRAFEPKHPLIWLKGIWHPELESVSLDEANRELGRQIVGFDAAASALLLRYDWPGNLRQLRNAVMSATLLATGRYITARDLPAELAGAPAPAPLRDRAGEEEQIRQALAATGGNKSQAARLLGIDRKTLYNKLHLYHIE